MKKIISLALFTILMLNAPLLADGKNGCKSNCPTTTCTEKKSAQKCGEIKTFYSDSAKVKTIYNYNADGKLDGLQKEFFESGKLKAEYQMKNGIRDGKGNEYYEDGQIAWERLFKDGTGLGTEYYPNGMKMRERVYENNKQVYVSEINHNIKGKKYNRNAEQLFAEGQEFGSKELYYHAIKTYEDFLVKFPKHEKASNVKFLIAFTYNNQLSDVENAKKHYNEFLAAYPTDPLKQSAEFELKTLGKSLDDMPEFKK